MPLAKEKTAEIVGKHQKAPGDTGTAPVQIALLTARINQISQHLQTNKKDFAGRLGLLKLVGQRRRLLRYYQKRDPQAYQQLIASLELRK